MSSKPTKMSEILVEKKYLEKYNWHNLQVAQFQSIKNSYTLASLKEEFEISYAHK